MGTNGCTISSTVISTVNLTHISSIVPLDEQSADESLVDSESTDSTTNIVDVKEDDTIGVAQTHGNNDGIWTLWMFAIGGPLLGLCGCGIMCVFMRYQMDMFKRETERISDFMRQNGHHGVVRVKSGSLSGVSPSIAGQQLPTINEFKFNPSHKVNISGNGHNGFDMRDFKLNGNNGQSGHNGNNGHSGHHQFEFNSPTSLKERISVFHIPGTSGSHRTMERIVDEIADMDLTESDDDANDDECPTSCTPRTPGDDEEDEEKAVVESRALKLKVTQSASVDTPGMDIDVVSLAKDEFIVGSISKSMQLSPFPKEGVRSLTAAGSTGTAFRYSKSKSRSMAATTGTPSLKDEMSSSTVESVMENIIESPITQ